MKILRDRPPLFDAIDEVFKVRGKCILFSWGDKIYVPTGSLDISPALIAHERAHGDRQLAFGDRVALTDADREANITRWWQHYLIDVDFRRKEEIIGHGAEYRYLCEHAGGRNQRRRHLSVVATKLSHPLYGPLMNKPTARKVLEDGYPSHP